MKHGLPAIYVSRGTDGRLIVAEVMEGSPAADAGVVLGDTIAKVQGNSVTTPEEFNKSFRATKPGEAVRLELVRMGTSIEIEFGLVSFDDIVSLRNRPQARP